MTGSIVELGAWSFGIAATSLLEPASTQAERHRSGIAEVDPRELVPGECAHWLLCKLGL